MSRCCSCKRPWVNILHNAESWKRPKLLCINHQCHIDAPLWNTARYYSLACYSGSGACSLAMPTNPRLHAGSDSGSDFQAKRQLMIDQIMGSNVSVAAKSQQITAIMDLLSSVPAPVSSLRSSGRSSQPELFNGRAAEQQDHILSTAQGTVTDRGR